MKTSCMPLPLELALTPIVGTPVSGCWMLP
jgi:hypothetical protein